VSSVGPGRGTHGWGKPWALLTARLVLGLIFFMAGVWKVFDLGPVAHAQGMFVDGYRDTFLPLWSLWATGMAVPWIELVAGGLVIVGFQRRFAYLALASVLVLVTFGHLLSEPLYALNQHVIPRLGLLLFLLWVPLLEDRFAADEIIGRRRNGEKSQ
jgi:uncharacterized membrane protein YphA (DoxX/SURF4 family)